MKDKKIMIVEDNELNMELIEEILESNEYKVIKAERGDVVHKMVLDNNPSLVLMDIQVPGIDGLTATKILKEDERTKDIPVIALTAHAMVGDEKKS